MPSLDTPISYHRLKRAPLDDKEVFNNLRDLMDYCKDGARYNGQRVVVLNDNYKSVEYTIKNNIPIINMIGSEPIFKSLTFDGESSESHGLLIYENNNLSEIWERDEVFSFNEGKLCLFNQLEIFRILDAAGNKTFKFYMERQIRNSDQPQSITRWNQNYNPYIDGSSNIISNKSDVLVSQISYNNESSDDGWIKTNSTSLYLMPNSITSVVSEAEYITKIYIKAEDYYQACN